jgi:peptidyl-tRNA hydrolase
MEDKQVIDKAIAQVADIIDCILSEGIDTAMNRYN